MYMSTTRVGAGLCCVSMSTKIPNSRRVDSLSADDQTGKARVDPAPVAGNEPPHTVHACTCLHECLCFRWRRPRECLRYRLFLQRSGATCCSQDWRSVVHTVEILVPLSNTAVSNLLLAFDYSLVFEAKHCRQYRGCPDEQYELVEDVVYDDPVFFRDCRSISILLTFRTHRATHFG